MRLRFLLFSVLPLLCNAQDGGVKSEWPTTAQNEEEALFLRRIADFWQEGEVQLAKNQMEEFLFQFPESAFSDLLCVALGDLYLREKNYQNAVNFYVRVAAPEFSRRVFLSRMQCLYHMQWYATLADECEQFLQQEESLEENQKLQGSYYLAIALYHQCLNAGKDPDALQKLAERAQPYFEMLFHSELSAEVGGAFAHLCCILKDFPKASQIYLDLAKSDPSSREEMLFQAALIQAEYDKDLAIQSFSEIARGGEKRAKEAAYNRMVLSYETGHHDEIVQAKEEFLDQMPQEREGMAHLFLGRSFLALKKYSEAASELKTYLQDAKPSETLRPAILSLLESSYQAGDLLTLDDGIHKLKELYPTDQELPKALFSRVQILKKNQKLQEAHAELEGLIANFPQFPQKAQVLFELAHLDYQSKSWITCRAAAHTFVNQFPNHDLAPYAWRYLVSASSELANEDESLKEQLAFDIESLLRQKNILSISERCDWQFLLAKSIFELHSYDKAAKILESLLASKTPFSQEANAALLLALCFRDGAADLARFCQKAEEALSQKATLLGSAQIHSALFNAYLEQSQSRPELLAKAADHLYEAFVAKADLQSENLLWLADVYYKQLQEEIENDAISSLPLAQRTISIFERMLKSSHLENSDEALFLEPALCKLAKLYSLLGRIDDQIRLLEKLTAQYPSFPDLEWSCEQQAKLLLAEGYAKTGKVEKASELFGSILSSNATIKNAIAASASLQSARLKLGEVFQKKPAQSNPDLEKVIAQLKNLIIQRTLSNEPLHLEAALDYIDLQTKLENPSKAVQKKLQLLLKTKGDFEQKDDLLSKDYHEARSKLPRKDRIYNGYMQLIDAQILTLKAELAKEPQQQKELQAKAKDLLLHIVEEQVHPSLVGRARQQLRPKLDAKA